MSDAGLGCVQDGIHRADELLVEVGGTLNDHPVPRLFFRYTGSSGVVTRTANGSDLIQELEPASLFSALLCYQATVRRIAEPERTCHHSAAERGSMKLPVSTTATTSSAPLAVPMGWPAGRAGNR